MVGPEIPQQEREEVDRGRKEVGEMKEEKEEEGEEVDEGDGGGRNVRRI